MTRNNTYVLGVACLVTTCLAAACAMADQDSGRSTAAESLQGVTWEWTETATPDRRIRVAAPDRYTVRFKGDGEAQIRYDCNHGGGMYELDKGQLSFGPLTYTRIRCGEGSWSFLYRQQLGAVRSFFTENGDLYLELPEGTGTMRFRRAGGN